KRIKMKLTVEDNSAGDTVNAGGGAAVPIINKRRAETEVLVKEGDTLVIGGITQRTDLESTRKVPIFGDIPVLGWLFKSRLVQTTPNRELVIFVTPSVLRRDAPRAGLPTGTAASRQARRSWAASSGSSPRASPTVRHWTPSSMASRPACRCPTPTSTAT